MLGSTQILGVFGHPVSHSLSPVMHNAAIRALDLDYVYVPFHVPPSDLGKAVEGIRALGIAGVNVTIPHKERIIEYLDEVSENAMRIGSVNTVANRDGRLIGDSTDGPGFLRPAEEAWGTIGGRALILGAGGSAKAVAFTLAQNGCEVVIANRTHERAEELAEGLRAVFGSNISKAIELRGEVIAEEIGGIDLLVNTTSVGMSPNTDGIPLPPQLLHAGLKVYDLVYNPLKTRLIKEAESRGAKTMTGIKMLVYQGALSFEMWTGQRPPIDVMERAVAEALGEVAQSFVRPDLQSGTEGQSGDL